MVVAHNLLAANTNRQLGIITGGKKKSTEKLASGYRINRSADDAAGLTISEKMRWQVRGLDKASNNIQDGVSLIQTAEGALNETHSILQRMRELAVQAANDTNTDADRDAIQQEINQLTTEVDRIAKTTSFNGSIYPLNAQKLESPYVYTDGNAVYELKDVTSTHTVRNDVFSSSSPANYQFGVTRPVISNGKEYYVGDSITLKGIAIDSDSYMIVNGSVSPNGKILSKTDSSLSTVYNASHLLNTFDLSLTDLRVDENRNVYFLNGKGRRMYLGIDKTTGELDACRDMKYDSLNYLRGVTTDTTIHIQSGALKDQSIDIEMIDATCSGIELGVPVMVSSFEEAGESIENIDGAISRVSAYRATFGAQQNRLEHAQSVDDNISENTSASESRLRDTDMAKEMVTFSKHSILEQAGQAMLAQANQSTQGALSLIQ